MEKMENEKVRWRLAMRFALSPSERWLIKVAEWNPELSSNTGPTDQSEVQEKDGKMTSTNSSDKLMKAATKSIKIGSTQKTTNSERRHENNTRTRRNSHNIPARYINGVKLSDEEFADIT